MIVGAIPFGLIFGTLAAQGPLAAWQGPMMSATVFAGSAQFIALGLVAGHTGLLVIWLTTFVVNLRHMLYAATLLPSVAILPLRWRLGLGFLLTDETFAVMVARRSRVTDDPSVHWYFLGSGLAMYASWNTVTLAGLLFGSAFPRLQSLGLEYAIVATFVAIIVPLVVAPEGALDLSWHNPQLIATLAAIGIAATARQPLLTIIGGLGVFFVWRFVALG